MAHTNVNNLALLFIEGFGEVRMVPKTPHYIIYVPRCLLFFEVLLQGGLRSD